MSVGYQSLSVDAFDLGILTEAIADSSFDQRLLRGGRFCAALERLILPQSRLDRGQYSLPCFGRGAIPDGWINVGLTDRIDEPAWVNGLHLHANDFQIYAENTPVDYRCAPGAAWFAFQVRREDLQRASLAVNGAEIALPTRGFWNVRLPAPLALLLLTLFRSSLAVGSQLPKTPDHIAEVIEQNLTAGVVRTLFDATLVQDGRTDRALRRKRSVLTTVEDFLKDHLSGEFLLRELVTATGMSERSLEYIVKDAYGVSPRELMQITRLHRIRHDLIAGAPETTSVRMVADQWGIRHGGRFAATYRRLFGEPPHETLARRNQDWGR